MGWIGSLQFSARRWCLARRAKPVLARRSALPCRRIPRCRRSAAGEGRLGADGLSRLLDERSDVVLHGWQRCDTARGSCTPISGATSKQYTVTTADAVFAVAEPRPPSDVRIAGKRRIGAVAPGGSSFEAPG